MKSFKYLSLMSFVLMSVFMFTACGSDDDDDGGDLSAVEKALVGFWEEDYNPYEMISIEFKSNHTGVVKWTSERNPEENETISFKWSATERIITFIADGETDVVTYTIEDNKLTYTSEEDTVTLYKKK